MSVEVSLATFGMAFFGFYRYVFTAGCGPCQVNNRRWSREFHAAYLGFRTSAPYLHHRFPGAMQISTAECWRFDIFSLPLRPDLIKDNGGV